MDAILRGLLAGTSKRPSDARAPPTAAAAAQQQRGGKAAPGKLAWKPSVPPPKRPAAAPSNEDDADGSEDDNEDDGGMELIAGRGTVGSSSSSSAAAAGAGAGSKAAAAAATAAQQHADEVRAFRKRLGIKVTGSAPVDPYAQFTAIPQAVGGDVAAHVSDVSCVRFTPAPPLPAAPPAAAAGSAKKRPPPPPAPVPTAVPAAQVAAAAAARHGAVRRAVLANIERSAFAEPLPVQMQALPALLAGRDVMAVAPTGSGKTAAFGLPLILGLQGHAPVGPRALVLTPTKELAAQTHRELTRLAEGTGLRCAVLTRAAASSVAGGRVSATADAGDLVKVHGKQGSGKKRAHGGGSGAGKGSKRQRSAAHDSDGDDDDEEMEGAVDSEDDGEDDEDDVAEDDDDGSDAEDDDEYISSAGGSDSGSGGHAPRRHRDGGGSSKPAAPALPPLSFPRTVVAPPLPRADILIATPLMLVSLLRHAQAAAAAASAPAASGASAAATAHAGDDSDDDASSVPSADDAHLPKVILPALRLLVLDEADRLLELGFLEQVDALFDARPSPATLAAYVAEEAAEIAERRALVTAQTAGTAKLPPGLASSLDAREKELRAVAGAAGVPVRLASPPAPAASSPSVRVRVAMLSATMPSGIEELALTVLHDPLRITVGGNKDGGAAASVAQSLLFVGREDGKLLALRQLVADGKLAPPVLVFVQSKDRAAQLAQALSLEGVAADAIHADKTEEERADVIARFRRGSVWVLVATDLMGRGMDFPAVKQVINYDFPPSAVAYIHRIGRTGRGGRTGSAVTLFTEADLPALRSIANVMRLSGCDVPGWMLELRKMGRSDRKRLEKQPAKRAPIFSTRTKYDAKVARREREERRAAKGKGKAGRAPAAAANE